jgi:serine/threonine protein phosphatase PrpC
VIVTPVAEPGCALWTHESSEMIALGVWTEKKLDQGEDAEPLVLYYDTSQHGLLAVCDGVGGAGAHTAGHTRKGTERSGAWVASRAVRLALEQYFLQHVRFVSTSGRHESTTQMTPGWADGTPTANGAIPPSMDSNIRQVLGKLRKPTRSRISGTMQRELPTTLAAILFRRHAGYLQLRVRWAGDSRCYLLTGEAGLQQLSRDDTELPDALTSLEQDPPMTNQIAADTQYRIHCHKYTTRLPCILICATDGFFNYVETPAHFEYILLDTMASSTGTVEWGTLLTREVQEYTQDDASLSLIALGYQNFGELRETFSSRLTDLFKEHWQPLRQIGQSGGDAYRTARNASWQRYRRSYEELNSRKPRGRDEAG